MICPRDTASQGGARQAGLDLLRGLAALAVMSFHFLEAADSAAPGFPQFKLGQVGVQVFFALSGYVIMLTAQRTPDRRSFALARFYRLYPAFLACMLLTTAWVFAWNLSVWKVTPLEWVANLTMFPAAFGAGAVDGPYWTLGYELMFYVLVAALLPWVKRGYALHYCVVYLLISPMLPDFSARCCACFVIGVALHEVERDRVMGLAVLVGAILCGRNFGQTLIALLAVAGGLSISVPYRLSGFALQVGALSYPLYLVHHHIGWTIVPLGGPVVGVVPALVVATVVVLAASRCINLFVEIPFARWRKERVRPRISRVFADSPSG